MSHRYLPTFPQRVDRQIPDADPLWDALDAISNATDAAEDETNGVVVVTHGPLTRYSAGESVVTFDAIDRLKSLDFVEVGGSDYCPEVVPTDRGRYHLVRWVQRVRMASR